MYPARDFCIEKNRHMEFHRNHSWELIHLHYLRFSLVLGMLLAKTILLFNTLSGSVC
jgi:hypothetical protein